MLNKGTFEDFISLTVNIVYHKIFDFTNILYMYLI